MPAPISIVAAVDVAKINACGKSLRYTPVELGLALPIGQYGGIKMIGLMLLALAVTPTDASFAHVAIVEPPTGLGFRNAESIAAWSYPSDALKNNESGTVSVRLGLGPDGSVNRCDIIGSSGGQALDEGSCWLLQNETVVGGSATAKLPFMIDVRVSWTLPPLDHPSRASVDASIFRADDYPKDAVDDEAEGITSVELTLGTGGKVNACRVRETSGHPSLDAKTCQIFVERGHAFMAGSSAKLPATLKTRVKWTLPQGIYFGNWTQEVRVRPAADPEESTCLDISDSGTSTLMPFECLGMVALVSTLRPDSNAPVRGEVSFVDGIIEDGDVADIEAKMVGTILLRSAVRITVADNGKVVRCEEVKAAEWKRDSVNPDATDTCASSRALRFESVDERRPEKSDMRPPSEMRRGIFFHFVTQAETVTDG